MSNDSRRGADLEEVVPRWDRVRLNSQPAERILCTLIRPAFSVAEGVPGLVFGVGDKALDWPPDAPWRRAGACTKNRSVGHLTSFGL